MSLHVDVNIYINTFLGTSSQRCASVDDACCCLSQSSRAASRNVDEQIAAALLRLQRDMATIMHRLDALEALALSQVKGHFWCFIISCKPLKFDLSPLFFPCLSSQDHVRQDRKSPYPWPKRS